MADDSADVNAKDDDQAPPEVSIPSGSNRLPVVARLLWDLAGVSALGALIVLFALGPRSTPPADQGLTADQVRAELQSQLAPLHAARTDSLPGQIKEELRKIKTDTETLSKSAQQMQEDFKAISSTAGTFQTLSTDLKKDLTGIAEGLASLGKDLKDQGKRIEAMEKRSPPPAQVQLEPRDVLLVGLNSHNLPISRYLASFKTVLLDEDLLAAGQPNHRVGFSLVTGESCNDIFPVSGDLRQEGEKTFYGITAPVKGITDRMDNLGPKVRQQLKDPARQPRCVIVASTKCVTLKKEQFEAWNGLNVQVILIGADAPLWDQEAEKLRDWQVFCDYCGGGLHVLQPVEDGPPDPRVRDRLTRLLRDYLSPIPSLKKRS